ncbi:MAG: serine/threonine-protein phosphatase [Bacilli bacterium]|nr:serine/threonine-protein phosphatase [Bacilli bacterium]
MSLYEQYEKGFNLVIFCEKAYKILKEAVYMTVEADGIYDERDILVLWDYIVNVGNVECLTEKNGARDLVRSSFKMFGDFIDPRLLALVRDYQSMSIVDFLNTYFIKKEMKREEDRSINSGFLSELEFMDCASTTGFRRENNEDFVCTVVSPINNNIKLLLVCDGMGGFNNGEAASKIVALEIIRWFKFYDFNLGFDKIEKEINKVIEKARGIFRESYEMIGTTLTFAIVGENETLIGNIGDSRTYIIKDGVLTQITKDDSKVWKEFYEGEEFLFEKDDLRFLPNNNILTEAIDDYRLPIYLQTYYILNCSYDGILLVSDGITDILSDKSITRIINETAEGDILDKLLYEACCGNPDFPPAYYDEVLYPTLPGGDNASAAVYLKRK